MKKVLGEVVFVAFLILMAGMLLLFVHTAFNSIDKAEKSGNVIVGESVVIGNDTLVIVDYKLWSEKYTLSNGVEISEEYAKKLLSE